MESFFILLLLLSLGCWYAAAKVQHASTAMIDGINSLSAVKTIMVKIRKPSSDPNTPNMCRVTS